MATIRKKGDYQWHIQVRKKGYPTQTRTFTTKADAERWGKETEIAIERGLFFDRTVEHVGLLECFKCLQH